MYNFYGQHGEDFILSELFKNQGYGFFIEIGCIDGRRFSNTLTFEERGWTGLCIEAHKDYIELLKKNRPKSIIYHTAIGERDANEVIFYANSRGSASTLDKSKELEFKRRFKEYFTGFEEQKVKMNTINTVLKESTVTNIDILSLDIEGYEVQALMGFDIGKWHPKVLVVESDDLYVEKKLDNLILKHNYTKGIRMQQNIFYLENSIKIDHLFNKKFFFKLIHTQHPLDENGDTVTEVILSLLPGRKENSLPNEITPEILISKLEFI